MTPLRLLIVDDSVDFLHTARRYLENQKNISVIGTAGSGEEAMRLTADLNPDLVLMDLVMPGMGGLAATRQLSSDFPNTRVVILTLHDLEEYRRAAHDAGAKAFVVKTEIFDRLLSVLDDVMARAD